MADPSSTNPSSTKAPTEPFLLVALHIVLTIFIFISAAAFFSLGVESADDGEPDTSLLDGVPAAAITVAVYWAGLLAYALVKHVKDRGRP